MLVISAAINTVSSSKEKTVFAYYNIMGQKLQKASANGLYILFCIMMGQERKE